MSDENAFQAALDANPDDFDTRGVFADWLEERGDKRAEGYRALWVLRHIPFAAKVKTSHIWYSAVEATDVDPYSDLPHDWFELVAKEREKWGRAKKIFTSRREAEDAAALAFAKLSESRRAELLAQPATA